MPLSLRLCRVPCGNALPYRSILKGLCGYAAGERVRVHVDRMTRRRSRKGIVGKAEPYRTGRGKPPNIGGSAGEKAAAPPDSVVRNFRRQAHLYGN